MADITPKGSPEASTPPAGGVSSGKIDLSIKPTDKPAPGPQPTPTQPAAAPTSGPAAQPVTATPPPAPAPAKKPGITFTNIFNQQKEKKVESKVISSVLQKKAGPSAVKPILGAAPALQKSLDEEKKIQLKRKLRLVQMVFIIVFLAGAASAGYFYSELSPTFDLFGPNTTQRLADTNESLRGVQTQINKYRYLAAQLALNEFSFVSDDFLDKTAQLSGNPGAAQLQQLRQGIAQASQDLPTILSNVKQQLTPSIVVPTVQSAAEEEMTPEQMELKAADALKNALLEDRRQITQNSETNEQDLKIIDNTLQLVGNQKLLSSIRGVSIDNFSTQLTAYAEDLDPVKRDDLRSLMSSILASTKSDIATIGSIKATRIDWSSIMKQIEAVTGDPEVDPTFQPERCLALSIGDGICYTGYDFDTSTNKIVLSGVTRTTQADNFTLISNLMDHLELSSFFQNVDMRSFSKSGTFAQGFIANFKIDLALESDGFSEKNAPISLESRRVASSGVKRNP